MKRHRLEFVLAVVMAVVFGLVCRWQAPARVLTKADVETYLARIEAGVELPGDEKQQIVDHLRAWGEGDDGRPVYMLNLMRYHETARSMPGRPEIGGDPRALNAHYEEVAVPKLLALGAYPVFIGVPEGVRDGEHPSTNILANEEALENWGRVLVVRYPDRRSFFELLSDPEYLPVLPYKLAALKVMLMPMHEEAVIVDLRLQVAMLMLAILAVVAIVRANRRGHAA